MSLDHATIGPDINLPTFEGGTSLRVKEGKRRGGFLSFYGPLSRLCPREAILFGVKNGNKVVFGSCFKKPEDY